MTRPRWNRGWIGLLAAAVCSAACLSAADPERAGWQPPSQPRPPAATADAVLEELSPEIHQTQETSPLLPSQPLAPAIPGGLLPTSPVLPQANFAARANALRNLRLSARNRAPAMIGDFFGGGRSTEIVIPGRGFLAPAAFPELEASLPVIVPTDPSAPYTFSVPVPEFGSVHETQFGSQTVSAVFAASPQTPILMHRPPDNFDAAAKAFVQGQLQILPTGEQLADAQVSYAAGFAEFDPAQSPPLGNQRGIVSGDHFFLNYLYQVEPNIIVNLPSPSFGGGNVGRVKLAENTSPMPRDRILMFYSHFDNVPLTPNGVSVNRYTPGFEKTLFDGRASVELRIPFATTLDTDIFTNGTTNTGDVRFGNVGLIAKVLLHESDAWTISGGLQFGLPTSDDTRVIRPDGSEVLRLENDALYLLPFLGVLYTPNDRFFAQAFIQSEFAANGNPVFGRFAGQADETLLGRLNAPAFLFTDISIGYWAFRNDTGLQAVTGVAPMLELHHNRSLEGTDTVLARMENQRFAVGNFADTIESLNLVVGATVEFQFDTTLTLALATPIAGGADREFDGELRLLFSHRFGPSSIRSRAF